MYAKVQERLKKMQILGAFMGHQGGKANETPRIVRDNIFITRGNPDFPEHDAQGYRNPLPPSSASVAIIGSSQVYGTGVSKAQAWPTQLQELLGQPTRSMAVPGWGADQFLMAAESSLSAMPSHIIVGLSLATDIYDSYLFAKNSAAAIARELAPTNIRDIPAPEFAIRTRTERLIRQTQAANPKCSHAALFADLSARGVLDCSYCAIESSRFYLTEHYRSDMQDTSIPAIAAGFTVIKRSIARLARLAEENSIGLSIVLIPTREYLVFCRNNEAKLRTPGTLEKLGEVESANLKRLATICGAHGIHCVDLSKSLKHYIGLEIFPQDSRDGHFNEKGCGIIARQIHSAIEPAFQTSILARFFAAS